MDANALSVSVKRLRDKLGTPDSIKTVYGIGYMDAIADNSSEAGRAKNRRVEIFITNDEY